MFTGILRGFTTSFKKLLSYSSRLVLIVSVFIITITIFMKLMPQRQSSSIETIISKQSYKFETGFRDVSKSKLTPEDTLALNLHKALFCKTSGDFCHADVSLKTKGDRDASFANKAAQIVSFPFENMPASGIQTTLDTIAQSGVVPKSYAALGVGFGGLTPYSYLWEQMRNITYIVLVLIILYTGFIVMFRSGMSTNTVVSIENMLPKIIVTMILIQLSFALAGFLIDFMYIISTMVIGIFGPLISPKLSMTGLLEQYLYSSPFGLVQNMIGPGGLFDGLTRLFYTIPSSLMSIFGEQMRYVIRFFIIFIGYTVLNPAYSSVFNPPVGPTGATVSLTSAIAGVRAVIGILASMGIISGAGAGLLAVLPALILVASYLPFIIVLILPELVIGLVLAFALLFAAWKMFLMMLKAYIRIILFTIFAPIIFALDIVPGKSGFILWLKSMARELAVFPLYILMIIVSFIIMSFESTGIGLRLPFLSTLDPQAFVFVIGLALLAMTPSLVESIRTAMFGSGANFIDEAKVKGALGQGVPWMTKVPYIGTGTRAVRDRFAGRTPERDLLESIRRYIP